MFYFAQFRPDKKEAWRMLDERQIGSLSQVPAFMTVLKLDQDPEQLAEAGEDPIDHVKYFGPMYWDLDGPSIDPVLDDARDLLDWLINKLEIEPAFIHCWLSGQKGVHITVPAEVFGLRAPIKALPLVYREIAESKKVDHLDMGVYSANNGRMWRCEGVPRPGTGTYKVGVTVQELQAMDADQYAVLVQQPRPPLSQRAPDKTEVFPRAESLFKTCRVSAQKRLKSIRGSTGVSSETIAKIEGVPGCIEKLITEGDGPESNWNQAAMQLAAYIAAKYEREDTEYEEELIEPFLKNVQSSSRSSERERRKHIKDQLNRAFSGKTKFYIGGLISVLGRPCGNCVLCNQKVASEAGVDVNEGAQYLYCERTKIKESPKGYLMAGENSFRDLTSWIFRPHTGLYDLEFDDSGNYKESARKAMVGTLTDDTGDEFSDFILNESAWRGRRDLSQHLEGIGTSMVTASDTDIQKLFRAVMTFSKGNMEKITRTPMCGLILEKRDEVTIPHYVEYGGSYTQHNIASRFKYVGKQDLSPTLLEGDYPYENDEELSKAIHGLCRTNEPQVMAAAIGWAAACHFREHIHQEFNQFPILNMSGNAESGKSSLAFLLFMLNGMDYSTTDFINAEVTSIFPLIKYVSSSSTVPRLIEEFNPANIPPREYMKILGILKGSWNRAAIPRGFVAGKEVRTTTDRVSAPIAYTSEQPPEAPAVRSRSVEVKMTSKALLNPKYVKGYKKALEHKDALPRLAKAMVTKALHTSPRVVSERMQALSELIPEDIGHRPKFGYEVCMFGLDMMAETLSELGQEEAAGSIKALSRVIPKYVELSLQTIKGDKRRSEVDRVLAALNQMAEDQEDQRMGLRPGIHYWRNGNQLYLNLQSCVPRYVRYARGQGENPVIRDHRQMVSLIEGEIYFDRMEHHPYISELPIHVLNTDQLASKGTVLNNFQDQTEPE